MELKDMPVVAENHPAAIADQAARDKAKQQALIAGGDDDDGSDVDDLGEDTEVSPTSTSSTEELEQKNKV